MNNPYPKLDFLSYRIKKIPIGFYASGSTDFPGNERELQGQQVCMMCPKTW